MATLVAFNATKVAMVALRRKRSGYFLYRSSMVVA
jgi:hypothetical protein